MVKFNIIAAGCQSRGIGLNGGMVWDLPHEFNHFLSTTQRVKDKSKQNVVIMGRISYAGMPTQPLPNRLNIVLTSDPDRGNFNGALAFRNLDSAMKYLDKIRDEIETVWICGGGSLYREAIESSRCHRVYYTHIYADFQCDTFFPEIGPSFSRTRDPNVPAETQEENGLRYDFQVWQRRLTERG